MTQEIIITDQYTGPNRRVYSKTLEQLEADITRMIKDHEDRERIWINNIIGDLKTEAFPSGDLTGHCGYHESKIRAAQAEAEFWKTAKEEAIKRGVGGIIAVLKTVLILSLLGLAYKVGLGPIVTKLLGVT